VSAPVSAGRVQWDLWLSPVKVRPGPAQLASPTVPVGVSGHSRFIVARMIGSQEAHYRH
jgi:hypothetical protein